MGNVLFGAFLNALVTDNGDVELVGCVPREPVLATKPCFEELESGCKVATDLKTHVPLVCFALKGIERKGKFVSVLVYTIPQHTYLNLMEKIGRRELSRTRRDIAIKVLGSCDCLCDYDGYPLVELGVAVLGPC